MIDSAYGVNSPFSSGLEHAGTLYGLAIRQVAGNVTRDHAIERFEEMHRSRLLTSK